jgi:hypothetical protein
MSLDSTLEQNCFCCFRIKRSTHLLDDARILPCSHSACLKCITESSMENNSLLICEHCNQLHEISLIKALALPTNNKINFSIELEKHCLASLDKLNKKIDDLILKSKKGRKNF